MLSVRRCAPTSPCPKGVEACDTDGRGRRVRVQARRWTPDSEACRRERIEEPQCAVRRVARRIILKSVRSGNFETAPLFDFPRQSSERSYVLVDPLAQLVEQ